jgi:hypothetical protein
MLCITNLYNNSDKNNLAKSLVSKVVRFRSDALIMNLAHFLLWFVLSNLVSS